MKFGRKAKLTTAQIDHARKLIDKGEARQYVADLLNVGRSTLYRALVAVSSKNKHIRNQRLNPASRQFWHEDSPATGPDL